MDIVNAVYSGNKEFRKYTPQIIQIQEAIKNILPHENIDLLEDLENYKNLRGKVLFEELYRQGLCDGLRLGNITSNRIRKRGKYHIKK